MFKFLKNLWLAIRYLDLYVIADSRDNSITFSRGLFRRIRCRVEGQKSPKVIVFRIPDCNSFGFMINPDISKPTQLADIQFNEKYRSVGFESLCPTVVRIFHEYRINPILSKVSLSVRPDTTPDGSPFYIIIPPRS